MTLVVSAVIALVVYARRRSRRLRGSFLGPDFVEPPDEWEVSSGDMTLLEKLGDGFFGVVHKAYLYRRPSRNTAKIAANETSSFGNEKSVVACKMLKSNFFSHLHFNFIYNMLSSMNF